MARVRRHQFDPLEKMEIHHAGIELNNIEATLHLFREQLGFTLKDQFQWGDEKIVFLQKGDLHVELVKPLTRCIKQPEYHLAVLVKDINGIITFFENSFEIEPSETYPNGWKSAFMKISNGLYIEWLEIPL